MLPAAVRRRPLAWLFGLGLSALTALSACAPAGSSTAATAPPAAAAPTTAAPTTAPTSAPAASLTPAPTSAPAATPTAARASTVLVRDDATLGKILTDTTGRTLYKFARDTENTSTCNDACAQTWPPFAPPAGDLVAPAGVSGKLATLTRADGTKQVSYNGAPLYFYRGDAQPGDTRGQGVAGVWFVVNP